MSVAFWDYKITGDRASHARAGVGPASDYAVPWGTVFRTPFAGRFERFETTAGGRSARLIGDEFICVVQHLEDRLNAHGAQLDWKADFAKSGNTGTATTGPHVHAYIIVRATGERISFQEWLDRYVNTSKPASTPAPAAKWYFDVPADGQYYYNQYNNALNGNYDKNQLIYSGSREVVENPGTGPVRIKANDGTLIWVGTRNNPAKIRKG